MRTPTPRSGRAYTTRPDFSTSPSIDDATRIVLRMAVCGDAALAFTVTAPGRGAPARYRYLAGAAAREADQRRQESQRQP